MSRRILNSSQWLLCNLASQHLFFSFLTWSLWFPRLDTGSLIASSISYLISKQVRVKTLRASYFITNLQVSKTRHFLAVYDICRLQTADCRLQTADWRPQIAVCKLKDTKNLRNKGDTIKNITSCESEKVAKLASFPRCCWLFFTDATLY